ncbi:AraC family transcriptional regulator [Treponema brennaborense]|uniref:Transcriptional regulator, AraC family n=1 Tax=Treponema brennaborense (strain DSM 12168 / CIP 105900 / DD5/3) TaxID=906968 RepID=F4LPH6_TREBD|nr:AraC family transcriptional regulator [Treponema brennaborense]AEE15987.1 transcriptional regulator, AraC family [Treponema brennaborense DSM 12168]
MEWFDRMNDAVSYIETHLTETVRYEEAARIACCSTFHFQRMFAYIAGVPLSEYIRRRKMSLAAVELQNGRKIIDVALAYGYESPTAFNRAFKSVHGMVPSAAKKRGVSVKSFPRITFQFSIKGDTVMEYRIETKGARRIVGVSCALDKDLEKNFAQVPKMWMKASLLGTVKKLAALQNDPELPGILGVSFCTGDDEWRYYIAAATDKSAPGKFETREIPAATWAIFSGEGPSQGIQELEKRIVTEWLPDSGWEYGSAPDIEVYLTPNPKHARYEVWIPVVKKVAD